MYFGTQQRRLLDLVRERIRNGFLTERGLARAIGVSQPQVHNVLKGARGLSPVLADALLRHLGITTLDLNQEESASWRRENQHPYRLVPLLRGGTGGPRSPFAPERHEGAMPFTASQVVRLDNPAALILHHDPAMSPYFQAGDVALLDRTEALLRRPDDSHAWLVETQGGPLVRYIRHSGRSLYLPTARTLRHPEKWDYLSLIGRNILEIVRGRIVWIGRGMEARAPGPDREAGGDYLFSGGAR